VSLLAATPDALFCRDGTAYLCQHRLMSVNGERVMALARLTRSRVLPGPEENVGVSIDSRVDGVADLVRVGEIAIALEVLADNLLDYDIRLTQEDFDEASALAEALGVSRDRFVAPLRDLVVPADRVVTTRDVD
jgi:hypothetical protein